MDGPSLLERHLPRFDHVERHVLDIDAAPDRAWRAIEDLDLGDSPVIRLLFRLRGLPKSALRLDGLERLGFVRLGERPGRELVLGIAGRFWTAGGDLQRLDPEGFDRFERSGFAKAVWNFRVVPLDGERSRIETETRILCLDTGSCRRFRLYWTLVRPFSGWTRREALRLIRARAEGRGDAGAPATPGNSDLPV